MTVFLSGPMGSGKSTLARALAQGKRVVDLDAAIEARHGASVGALFSTFGERGFRVIERAMAFELLQHPPDVVALGGGTVTDREVRRALLRSGTLITLTAPIDVLVARIAGDRSRPLLERAGEDRARALAQIVEARAEAYAECHATLDTAELDEARLVARAREIEAARPLLMPLGARSYPIFVGHGAASFLGERVAAIAPSSIVSVSDENTRTHAATVRTRVAPLGLPIVAVVLTPGETHKTLEAVEAIWDHALAARIDRRALVIAVGGGVVGDVAGFAAATLLRGIAFAQIPTTLLAMVDASVGGKTGFDRAEGKNLVGAFHQPRFVVCDLDVLRTLPERDYVSGLAEIIKAAWLTGEADVAALEHDVLALRGRDPEALAAAIRRAIATKIAIVSEDESELGIRAHLNLGHTLGHAIEAATGYARTHGECVALGLIAALRVGAALGDASAADLDRVTRLVTGLGLPTDLDAALGAGDLARFLAADKKRDATRVRFVVPGCPGRVRLESLDPERILALARG